MTPTTRRILISCGVLFVVACLCTGILAVSSAGVGFFTLLRSTSAPQSFAAELTPTIEFSTSLPTETPTSSVQADTATPSPQPSGSDTPTPTQGVIATPSPSDIPAVSDTPGVSDTPSASDTPSVSDTPGTSVPTSTLSPVVLQQMDTIQNQVMSYRGLKLKSPVIKDVLNHDQLVQKVKTDFLKNYTTTDAQRDSREYFAFGWLPANFDMIAFELAFQAEEIAGYYDNDTKQMYVVSDEGFKGFERWTYSHEFTHVLQDQNYDIKNGLKYSDAACKNQNERCAAVQALIEGDAVMSQNTWLNRFATNQDKLDIQNFYNNLQLPVTDAAPAYFKDDLSFPYQAGLEFLQSLYDRGGYAAIEAAFKNPPVDTHQILHPDDYPALKPVIVTLPDLTNTLGGTWKKIDSQTLGEWYTYLLLRDNLNSSAQLSTSAARNATSGWRGDSYAVYDNGTSDIPAVTLVTQWDSSADAQVFATAFTRYGNSRWGKSTSSNGVTTWQTTGAYASINLSGDKTTWIMAPSADVLQKITAGLK